MDCWASSGTQLGLRAAGLKTDVGLKIRASIRLLAEQEAATAATGLIKELASLASMQGRSCGVWWSHVELGTEESTKVGDAWAAACSVMGCFSDDGLLFA